MSDNPDLQVLLQLTGEKDHLYERLNQLLNRADLLRVRMAVAYARWDGIGLVAENLETFLADGGEFQCIYGVNNGVTTPDSFLYSLYLKELYGGHSYAGAVEDAYKTQPSIRNSSNSNTRTRLPPSSDRPTSQAAVWLGMQSSASR